MSANNPEYDFKWCPGCGDFAVRRAVESAIEARRVETELPVENNVVVAGIGCSGNLVHLLEGAQPYGFHGIHGRTLPVAMGIKMGSPDLNVLIVAGDGDFLGIGLEHIAPQAKRNLDVTAIIMDNAVYGLTKGQSSPTSPFDMVTSSTPYGKAEEAINPLQLYLTIGASVVVSAISTKVKDLTRAITDAMNHPGFAIVHVQSPCTTYNDTYELLKGSAKKGISPIAWPIPDDHDSGDLEAAYRVAGMPGVPLGTIFKSEQRPSFDHSVKGMTAKANVRELEKMIGTYAI